MKYPNLTELFPDDLIEQSLTKLEESEDEYKEFILELCHSYSKYVMYAFWVGLSAYASKLVEEFTLENFEKIEGAKRNGQQTTSE